jgi:uncharacterized protein YjbJ (UPF0337 family)
VPNQESGPRAGAESVAEDLKGKAKEAIGVVIGNDDMKAEGEVQQDKADAQRKVAEKEAAAEKERAKADALEAEQKIHQD